MFLRLSTEVNNFDLGVYCWIAIGQKCENVVEKYYLLVSVFMALSTIICVDCR